MKDKMTLNGKPIDPNSIKIDGIDRCDYPDFVDAFISSATFANGVELNVEELNQFNAENNFLASRMVYEERMWI